LVAGDLPERVQLLKQTPLAELKVLALSFQQLVRRAVAMVEKVN